MRAQTSQWAVGILTVALAAFGGACGSDSKTAAPSPTATRTSPPTATRTATRTSPPATNTLPPNATPTTHTTSGAVNGLVVVRNDGTSGPGEPLGAPPSEWIQNPDGKSFDRAFASAAWHAVGTCQKGVTTADGRFAISDLPPGRYTLEVAKTLNGNLVPLSIPFTVGDDGRADVVAEVGLGLVRTTSTYTQAGAHWAEIRGPYGNWLITRDGRIVELGDFGRVLTDANGDGKFDAGPCTVDLLACDTNSPCPGQQACQCISTCFACDNCGLPGICQIPTLPQPLQGVYRCGADGSCTQPGDTCRCVPSCPGCKDCALSICVPSCAPVEISRLSVNAPAQLVVGRQAQASAGAQLSDGTAIDVTYLATWQSSDPTVATVDSWGTVSALVIGTTRIGRA